jgi:glycosyltransferase involved in cell wall biosynthesis
MKKKIKILLVNSYSFDTIYENWKKNANPSHYLMGKIELDQTDEFEVTLLQHEKYKWLNRIGSFLKLPLLDQQVRTLFQLRKYDILYFPYPMSNSRLITTLKSLGLISTPIVVLVHQRVIDNPNKRSFSNWLARKSYQQFNAYACFSKNLLEKTVADLELSTKDAAKKFFHIRWGADHVFYQHLKQPLQPAQEKFAICAGTQDRDFNLIIEAFRHLDYRLKIYCTPATAPQVDVLPPNVTIDTSWVPYTQLLEEYMNSSFIIIPIKEEVKNKGNTYGLTVLLDAIALGIPAVMTYHPYVDIDIEKENIGKFVTNNTPRGWREVLTDMISKEEQFPIMGANAKNLYKTKYNSLIFSQEMAQLFKSVCPLGDRRH